MLKTMEKKKGWWLALCTIALAMLCAGFAPARAFADQTNLALRKTAVASGVEAGTQFTADKMFDGDESTRWASNNVDKNSCATTPRWVRVDLGSTQSISSVRLHWELRKATGYKIQVSTADAAPADTSSDWKTVYTYSGNPAKLTETLQLEGAPVQARHVRLYIDGTVWEDPDGNPKGSWGTASLYEMGVYGQDAPAPEQDMSANIARGCKGGSSDRETDGLNWDKLFDGNTTDKSSRWASRQDAGSQNHQPHWVRVDLGQTRTVGTVRLYWEQRKANGYEIQVANTADAPADGSSDWKTVYTNSGRPAKKVDTIKLNNPEQARHVRLVIKDHTTEDPDGGTAWGTVSLYEMEVYGGAPSISMNELADAIEVVTPNKGDKTLTVNYPDFDKNTYKVVYNGTDYEQVVGAQAKNGDIPIFQPVVDTQVKVSFKVTDKATNQYAFAEVPVTIPGEKQVAEGDNAAPTIVPELREWKGGSGTFALKDGSRVLYSDGALAGTAQALASDYQELFGKTLQVAKGANATANAGDIVLILASDKTAGLGDEGYRMEVTDRVVVTAEAQTGAYWSTRTILQALVTGNGSIPQGTARDYPLYKVRGFMLDVGRKTFSLDFLKQMAKEMAWYKMNDFHVHLNDNYIWVEEYTDETVDEAYSGFRLESDIKKGGANGKYKADLTSTDMFYTKDEFRTFIKDCRDMGVNVIPEFDMPAHSLSFTKVRPDLRTPNSAMLPQRPKRGNDHLNLLADKYNETFDFATTVWDEYLKGQDPVFDDETIIHIGADEFDADGNQYRKFVNDLFDHVEKTGRTARVWGSLTTIKGDGSVAVSGVNEETGARRQINLWNAGWANMKEMYDLGFELINCNDTQYYVVPNSGYYHPTGLDANTVYNNPINTIGGTTIPNGDEQMVGGMFAIWNDMSGKRENGMSEYDIYGLIHESAGLYASASWGKGGRNLDAAKAAVAKVGAAPETNFGYETAANKDGGIIQWNMDDLSDASGMGHDLAEGKNAGIVDVHGKKALELKGGESFIQMAGKDPLKTVGLNNSLRVKVMLAGEADKPQVLFESPYGKIMTVQEGTGQVGFTRENRAYSFNYKLPVNEWVELEFKNEKFFTSLYVNGTQVDRLGSAPDQALKATTMFPVEHIGSKTNSFKGFVDDVRICQNADFASTIELDKLVQKASGILAQTPSAELEALVSKARALMNELNPSGDAIAALCQQIQELLNVTEYKRADYSALDAYVAGIPSDEVLLSMYTSESVAALRTAIAAVDRELPASMQDVVDAHLAEIKRLAKALQPKDADALYAKNTTGTACTEHPLNAGEPAPNGPASNAVDGNVDTYWHSKWNAPADSCEDWHHWFNVKLSGATTVNGVKYVPRSGAANGRLIDYRIEVSTDGGNSYKQVAAGTVANPAQTSLIEFEAVPGVTDVKVWFDKTDGSSDANKNKFASAAEIAVRYVDDTVDLDGLNALIKQASSLDADKYTAESWKLLSDALVEAKRVAALADPTYEQVNEAKAALTSALLGLDALPPVTPEPGPNPGPTEPQEPSNPGDTSGSNKPGNPVKPNGNKPSKPGSALPGTGDSSMAPIVIVGALGLAAVIAGIVVVIRRKNAK